MNLLLNHEADEYILLLINTISMSKFDKFIKAINQKNGWSEELCSCYFETTSENEEYYRFETFEGDTYKLSYQKFLGYVRLAIIRYYLGCESDETKEALKRVIKNTVFDSVLDNVDLSLAIDFPLIG
mgnify:CR=1 FL=1